MKICSAAVATGLALISLHNVEAAPQTHFEMRSAVIANDVQIIPDSTTATIVMLGDSITEQFSSTESLPPRIHGLQVINQGIGGDNIGTSTSKTGVMSRLDFVKRARPAIVFVMIGVNDLWDKKEPLKPTLDEYETMVLALKSIVPNAKIVLQSVLPARGDAAYTNEKSAPLNDRIKQLASRHNLTWLDLRPLMQDDKGELKAEFTGDGVHLNKEAYRLWLAKLNEVTTTLLK